MQTWKEFLGGVDGMFLTFFSPHQSWTQLTPHFCPFTDASKKRSIRGTQHNVNRNRYGREITLVLFLRLFLTKSRKKSTCPDLFLLTETISDSLYLTFNYTFKEAGHMQLCRQSSNKSFVCNGQKNNSLDCTIFSSAELTTFPIENSTVYPLFLIHVQSSLVWHDIIVCFFKY